MKRARLHAAMAICLAVSMYMGGTGCSFMFAKKAPPQYKTMAAFDCTEGRTLPVLDVIVASLQAIRVATAAGAPDAAYEGAALSRGADIGLGVALGTLGIASAAYGFRVTNECRRAKDETRSPATGQEQIGWMPQPQPAVAPSEQRDTTRLPAPPADAAHSASE
jgi:hypothetical protein